MALDADPPLILPHHLAAFMPRRRPPLEEQGVAFARGIQHPRRRPGPDFANRVSLEVADALGNPPAAASPPSSNLPGPGVCYSLILIRVLLERITVLWSEGHHRSARALHVTIKTLLIGLTMLRYTPVLRWRVCRPPLDLLITGFLMGNALLELFLYPGSTAATMILACLDEDIRVDLCSSDKDTRDRAICLLVQIQLSSLDPLEITPPQQASLYFWGSSAMTYLGSFLWERQGEAHRTGATIRSEEHETLVAHPQHRD